jgi:hypothetical protein
MTEEEWLACEDPSKMLEFLRDKVSDRKLRIFEIACCHRIIHLLSDHRARGALTLVERFVDGFALPTDLIAAQPVLGAAIRDAWHERYAAEAHANFCEHPAYSAAGAVEGAVYGVGALFDQVALSLVSPSLENGWNTQGSPSTLSAAAAVRWAAAVMQLADRTRDRPLRENMQKRLANAESLAQSVLIRDIFPFRPITINPAWLTSTVLALAHQMYDSRDFSAMPILADALQDGGCENAQILEHCRGTGPHVRGCWVVDLCLRRG